MEKLSITRPTKSQIFICAIIAFTIAFLRLPAQGGKSELISPVPMVIQESCPTPTATPEPRLSYNYGKASWYGQEFCRGNPCRTASGAWFNENAFTAACADIFPLGTRLIVSYEESSVEIVCNDRGGFTQGYGRILDLSKAAFETLAPTSKGVIWVRVKKME